MGRYDIGEPVWVTIRGIRVNVGAKIQDVTQEYLDNASPGVGEVIVEPDIHHPNEDRTDDIKNAYWLRDTFGGNITVLNVDHSEETNRDLQTPDYSWDNRLFERKTPTSQNALDKHIQSGVHQINDKKSRSSDLQEGGFLLCNITKHIDLDTIHATIANRLRLQNQFYQLDIILKEGNKLIQVLRWHK